MSQEKIFLEMKWFDSGGAKRHLDHVTRVRTQIENPDWERIGDLSEAYLLEQTAKITKPLKNRIWELMTYTRSPEEVLSIKSYLEAKTDRQFNAYVHYDEGGQHTHFICRNAGPNGKALRLTLKDFGDIKRDIAGLLGRVLTQKGIGRRHLSLVQIKADPSALQRDADERESILTAVQRVIDPYKYCRAVQISCIAAKGKFDVQQLDPIKPVRDQLRCDRLRTLNHRGEGIYFKPIMGAKMQIGFLDDVPERLLGSLPEGSLVIETSPHKFQAHFSLPIPLPAPDIAKVQRVLCGLYEADPGSTDACHYRRLPGFTNQKYLAQPPVMIRDDIVPSGEPVSLGKIYNLLHVERRAQQQALQKATAARTRTEARKGWTSFKKEDSNRTDMSYTLYLIGQGYSDDEIRAALIAESENITIRKQRHLDSYIELTIWKGHEFFREWYTHPRARYAAHV